MNCKYGREELVMEWMPRLSKINTTLISSNYKSDLSFSSVKTFWNILNTDDWNEFLFDLMSAFSLPLFKISGCYAALSFVPQKGNSFVWVCVKSSLSGIGWRKGKAHADWSHLFCERSENRVRNINKTYIISLRWMNTKVAIIRQEMTEKRRELQGIMFKKHKKIKICFVYTKQTLKRRE